MLVLLLTSREALRIVVFLADDWNQEHLSFDEILARSRPFRDDYELCAPEAIFL